jgi:Na+/H+-dicarboxylate symporter
MNVNFLKSYRFSIVLIISILIGSGLGIILKDKASVFKPFGDVFLNLLFTIVVPMVFFSLSSAIAVMADMKRLGRILFWMIAVFVVTGIIASVVMIACVKIYPPAKGITLNLPPAAEAGQVSISQQIVRALTVTDFTELISKKNMLALIVFSILIGLAAAAAGQKAAAFTAFLKSGNEVLSRVLGYIMLYAPIGLGAYFAYLVGTFGPQLFGSYVRAITLYYPAALLYFAIAFSLYAYFAANSAGVKAFWSNIIPTSLTAWGTGSSVAAIPTNLEAAKRIGVPEDIREVVIPIGATIHMDGSCLAAILKIALLMGLFNIEPAGAGAFFKMLGVGLLAGIVVSGIPSGGLIGELMIVGLYGLPIEALPIITLVGTLVDPPATMVNSVGDNVSSMMITRIIEGKNWTKPRRIAPAVELVNVST